MCFTEKKITLIDIRYVFQEHQMSVQLDTIINVFNWLYHSQMSKLRIYVLFEDGNSDVI